MTDPLHRYYAALLGAGLICAAAPLHAAPPARTAPDLPAAEAGSPSVLDPIYACKAISADAERLKCYDEATGRLRQAEISGALITLDRATIETVERDSFGLNVASLPKLLRKRANTTPNDAPPEALSRIEAKVLSTSPGPDGKMTIRLDNGQIWRQTDGTHLNIPRKGVQMALIEKGVLGAYFMTLDRQPSFRAKRVE